MPIAYCPSPTDLLFDARRILKLQWVKDQERWGTLLRRRLRNWDLTCVVIQPLMLEYGSKLSGHWHRWPLAVDVLRDYRFKDPNQELDKLGRPL